MPFIGRWCLLKALETGEAGEIVEMMQHCAIFCNGKNAEAGANKNGAGSGIQGYGKGGSLKLRVPPPPHDRCSISM